MPGRPVVMPIELLAHEDALRHRRRIVERRLNRLPVRGHRIVTACRAEIPVRQLRDRGRERIQQQLVDIETMPLRRFVGTVNAVGVELPRPDAADPDMPDVPRAVMRGIQIDDPGGGGIARTGRTTPVVPRSLAG